MRPRRTSFLALLTVAAGALLASPAAAQQPTAATDSMPRIGEMAPDFTVIGATRYGLLAQPVHLSDFRGQTVVLSFFPKARTKGWTIQMEAYRDQYATIFNGGKGVVALSVSVDPDTTLANWARQSSFPVLFGSDPDQVASRLYGSARVQKDSTGRIVARYDARNVFVIGPDGRITHRITPLNVLSQDAYAELGRAVKATLPQAASASGNDEK